MESDLAAFGLDAPVTDFEHEEDGDYHVLPENWDALELFIECERQWRLAGMEGVRVGLDYTAVASVMSINEIENQRDVFRRLRDIEAGALEAMQEQRDKQ